METKLNYKRTFLIGLAFLSICSFWQMYDNIIPLILQNTYHLGETMTGKLNEPHGTERCSVPCGFQLCSVSAKPCAKRRAA
jgi:hypothetical protein